MENLIPGIITVIICLAGYYQSWKYQARDNYRMALWLLLISGLLLRIYTSTDFFLHYWDERYHALVAKNLMNHPFRPTLYDTPLLPYDYFNWPGNHIWLHKQPMALWLMAGSMKLFGINEIALRLPSILMSTTGIWMTWFTGKHLAGKKAGYLAAFFFSVNGLIIELTGGRVATDHIDIAFLFFIGMAVVLSIVFAQSRKPLFNILAGVALGAALLSKYLPALIVLPLWLLIVYDSGNFRLKTIALQFVILTGVGALVFLPWQIYIFRAFPAEAAWESQMNFRHLMEVIEELTGPFYYFADKIRINYGELVYLPLLWFLWKTIRNPRNLKMLAVTVWFLIPFVFFSLARTKMQGYMLFTAPALFIMTAVFWVMLSEIKTRSWYRYALNVLLVLFMLLPLRYSLERVKPFQISDRNPEWVKGLRALNREAPDNGVLLNYANPVEAMFYTGLTAYSEIPGEATVRELLDKGYTVIVNDKGDVPAGIAALEGVRLKKLAEAPAQ